jgi:hypothetical protein
MRIIEHLNLNLFRAAGAAGDLSRTLRTVNRGDLVKAMGKVNNAGDLLKTNRRAFAAATDALNNATKTGKGLDEASTAYKRASDALSDATTLKKTSLQDLGTLTGKVDNMDDVAKQVESFLDGDIIKVGKYGDDVVGKTRMSKIGDMIGRNKVTFSLFTASVGVILAAGILYGINNNAKLQITDVTSTLDAAPASLFKKASTRPSNSGSSTISVQITYKTVKNLPTDEDAIALTNDTIVSGIKEWTVTYVTDTKMIVNMSQVEYANIKTDDIVILQTNFKTRLNRASHDAGEAVGTVAGGVVEGAGAAASGLVEGAGDAVTNLTRGLLDGLNLFPSGTNIFTSLINYIYAIMGCICCIIMCVIGFDLYKVVK